MKSLAEKLLQAEGRSDSTEVSVLLTDDDNIRTLNKAYRAVDRPTDVLSFSQLDEDETTGFAVGAGEEVLGDVVISVESARRQAEEHNHGLDDEIDVLLAHGLLHLLGYDHAEPDEAREMFAKQAEILESAK